ncbi:MAG: exonuclease domain-containing protein [Sphingobacterium sp.]
MSVVEFAIVDIETTGGYAEAAGITEVAILIFNGKRIIDRFTSLIQPEQPIPLHIQVLTGISNEMVQDAPTFSQVASQILSFLEHRVFVAHQVHFDYSFLQAALKRAGHNWNASKLCTVRLSRRAFPNLPSYSLGKLCASLDIPLHDRHRAEGDAAATAILFDRIYNLDRDGMIQEMVKHHAKEQRLPTHIPTELWNNLPHSTGVYQFWDRQGKMIYVGKANNIRKRVTGHFTGNSTGQRRQQFINEIADITFEETGSELGALLKECHLIKSHWPRHNRALKKFEPKYGLVEYEDQIGYRRLSVVQVQKHLKPILYFQNIAESTQILLKIIRECNLERSLCHFYGERRITKNDAVVEERADFPSPALYNLLLDRALEMVENQKKSFIIVDKGRSNNEKSYVYVQDNQVYAVGFISDDVQLLNIHEVIEQKDRVRSNYYMNHLAEMHAQRYPERTIPVKFKTIEAGPQVPGSDDPLKNWIA